MSYAKCLSQDDKFSYFVCICESEFRILNDKSYSDGYISCASCKRDRKRKPYPNERMIFRRIAHDARIRSLSFEISIEWFVGVCHKPCHYCGMIDTNFSEGIFYNGLDRQDNLIGYTADNCVPCCFVCNRAKGSMSLEQFMLWVSTLVARNRGYS